MNRVTHNFIQIVDTTRYDQAAADEGTYRKIVLGAIDKGQDGKGSANTKHSLSSAQQAYGQSHTDPRVEIGHSAPAPYQYPNPRTGTTTGRTNTR